ncbi:hypothetical protein C6I21_03710 [Alkalicoccus urumqiensis]|uniref:Uncharacterized protein n=1 Tax=Alkalicoccus urumqiensis TaxID=1548213 RepID=A0A2P6MK74_ALKUR|nr:hypothetical protein C6I21_03710 [Alkalicoccus urumqiensis]
MNESGYFFNFEAISEPRTKDTSLRIIVNRSKEIADLLLFPDPDSKVTTFQIDFPNYITYSVTYDDYTVWDNGETFEGETFRIYSKSNYLDYVQKKFDLEGKQITHYSLACEEHHVDIISEHEPIVTEVSS